MILSNIAFERSFPPKRNTNFLTMYMHKHFNKSKQGTEHTWMLGMANGTVTT